MTAFKEQAQLVRIELGDGSYSFDVRVFQGDQEIDLGCTDEKSAKALLAAIELHSLMPVSAEVIERSLA